MHTLVALPPKSILPMLQQHGAHLLAWLLSLSRTPEPSRGAAAGPAGRAVETPYAAAAALSDAPGVGRANPSGGIPRGAHGGIATRCDRRHQAKRPRRMGNAARSPMAGKIWRTTTPSQADTSAAKPRFSVQIGRRIRLG